MREAHLLRSMAWQVAFLTRFAELFTQCCQMFAAKEKLRLEGTALMWEATVLKRLVDRNNASALRGAELKKLVQKSYSVVELAFRLLLVAPYFTHLTFHLLKDVVVDIPLGPP